MTPAAVDFRSPITSSQRSQSTQQSSSFGDPTPSENLSEQGTTSSGWCFSSQVNSEKPIPSSGRLKPRVSKVRKQSGSSHHGRSNSLSAKGNSFHSFIPATSENLCPSNDSMATAYGFSDSVNIFADLQNRGDSVLNPNGEQFNAGDNLGFVFGANYKLPNGENNKSYLRKGAVEKKNVVFGSSLRKNGGTFGVDETRKVENVGFRSQRFDNTAKSEPSSNPSESSRNIDREENEYNFKKVDDAEFVFGANKNIGRLHPENQGENKLENGGGDSNKSDYGGVPFSTSSSGIRSNSKLRHGAPKAYLKNKEFVRNAKKNVGVETESQNSKINSGSFIHGSGINESEGMNKLKNELAESCIGFTTSQIPVFSVSEKFQSLNILDSEKVGDCNSNSFGNFDSHTFVFGINKTETTPSIGITGISSSDQLKHRDQRNAFGKIDDFNTKINLKRVFEFGTSGSNQPVNLTKEGLDGNGAENLPNSNTEHNRSSFPTPLSSFGFSSQASEASPLDRVEKEKFNFTGFGRPSLNTPSFTNNLSSNLGKKLDFSANSSSSVRERKLRKTRGKPRQHNKVHLSKEEGNNPQKNHQKSPESFSPMDFSPYHATNTDSSKSKDQESEEPKGQFCGKKQEEEKGGSEQFSFAMTSGTSGDSEERKEKSSFSLSSKQENVSTIKRFRKYRMKTGSSPKFTTSSGNGGFASSWLDAEPGKNVNRPDLERKRDTFTKADEEQVKLEPTESPTLEACQSWRSRGNKAYGNGDLPIAEEFYTKGINAIPQTNISGSFIEALVLCYSNRATTRLALGKIREALEDCRMASSLDPNFLKVYIRAANCHLVLGEVEDAIQYFSKCLGSGNEVCLDRRITIEAAEGVQKAKNIIDSCNHSAEQLKRKTSAAASSALGIINEALSISCYSEKLLEMKGEALFMLRKYEEVVGMCERTLDFAEKNFATVDCRSKNSSVRLWRWRLMSKSYFYMGKLDVALDFIEKQEQLKSTNDKNQESLVTLAFTIRELLLRKNAGNEAFQFGKHSEAIEHYTAAISSSVESRPFAAVCFCNRAAAYQALGQITDAIADCSLSIALDGNYTKALSRRATLHEMIRDYEQAANDLQKLVSNLEHQSQNEKSKKSGGSSVKDLRRTRHRLSTIEEKARKGIPLDLYMILGIKASDPAAEIRKAYRKAALRHHPDKAGQFLARCEIGDDGHLYKEIAETIHTDADRLFKMIGQAYAILSDPTKRSKYDIREEMRDDVEEYKTSSSSSSFGGAYSSPFESSNNSRRYWRESWKAYGNSSSHW